jgi:uncharacterized protein (TIGR00288 family)
MAAPTDTASMALFCDFENVALGVRDAQYDKFDIRPVLERLLAKGSIVVKKAYCDWDRYKAFKSAMHEANFELIEIPHVRQSGKNSADIRLVVDALDLCYTKSHVDTFVIISGDSDFSPLVSKLRENAKRVIGVGVKQSCSDLLIANCDEFIYYDDLVRDRETARHNASRRESREPAVRRTPEEEKNRREKLEERKTKAVELVAATFADMSADRGEQERIWASVVKEVVKRRNPGFNESYYGFRSFGNLLEEAANRGLLGFGRDEKSGAYVTRAQPRVAAAENDLPLPVVDANVETVAVDGENVEKSEISVAEKSAPVTSPRRRGGRRTRQESERKAVFAEVLPSEPVAVSPVVPLSAVAEVLPDAETKSVEEVAAPKPRRRSPRRSRKDADSTTSVVEVTVPAPVPVAETVAPAAAAPKKRAPRSRKPKVVSES